MRLAYLLLLFAVLVITTGLLAEPTGTLPGYPAYVVYQAYKEDFSDGKWDYFTVKSAFSVGGSAKAGTYSNNSYSRAWRVSVQADASDRTGESYAKGWFNFTPVWSVSLTVTLANGYYVMDNIVTVYVNNVVYASFSTSASSMSRTVTVLARNATVSIWLSARVYNGAGGGGAYANATVLIDDVVAVKAASTAAAVTYTAYPNYTQYAVTLSYSGCPIFNATIRIPSDFAITSSSPSYTERNSTHVWWYNANTQTLTLQATSTTKIYPSFTWYPSYSGYRCDAVYFDGINDYVVVPLTVYGWQGITVQEVFYPFWPKANTAYSKFSMLGDVWGNQPVFVWGTNSPYSYTSLGFGFYTRKPVGSLASYGFSIYSYRNTWVNTAWSFNLSTRTLVGYINGQSVYSATISSTEATVLEWNPSTASKPQYYQRLVLGANVNGGEQMKMMQAFLLVYNRSLTPSEVAWNYQHPENPVRRGLVLWLAPWSFDPSTGKWYDLSGNRNHGTVYGDATCVKFLPNATYIAYQSNVVLAPLPARFFVKNSSGYFELGVSGDAGLLSKASPGAYQLAAVYTNGTHASMLLSPTVYVVTYELAWRVDSNANTIYVTQMRYRWPTSYGLGYYYPSFTVTVKPQNLTATGSNGYAELPFSESQFQPGSVTMYVFDAYGIVDKPVTIPVRNLTIVNFEVYGTDVYNIHFAVNLTYHDGSPFTGRLYLASNALKYPQYLGFNSTVRSWDVIITPYGGGANYINVSSVYVADSDCIVLKKHVTRYWVKFIVALTFDEIQLRDTYERGDILSGGIYVRNAGNFTLKDLKMRLRFRYEKNGYYYFDRMYNLSFGYYGTELPPQAGSSILLDEANVKLLLLEGNYTLRVTFYSGDTIVLAELVLPFYVGKYYTLAFVCVNQNNQPLAGIEVVAIDINRMKAYSAVTGAEGMAQLKLPAGQYIAYADEHAIETYTTLTLDSDKVIRWTLVTPMAQQTIVVQQPYSITEGITWVVLLAVSGAILYAALRGRQGGGR